MNRLHFLRSLGALLLAPAAVKALADESDDKEPKVVADGLGSYSIAWGKWRQPSYRYSVQAWDSIQIDRKLFVCDPKDFLDTGLLVDRDDIWDDEIFEGT